MEKTALKKILVVALDNLGDVVMATSLAHPLQFVFPQAEIGFWVKSYAADLLKDHPIIKRIHASDPFWDSSPGHPKGEFAHFRKTADDIKKENYDAVLVINAEWRRSAACWWIGIPVRIGFDRRKSRFFLSKAFSGSNPYRHFIADHQFLLEVWTKSVIEKDLFVPSLGTSPDDEEKVSGLLQNKGWPRLKLISLHPFAGDPLKCWPLNRWTELMKKLISFDPQLKFLIHCGSGEEDILRAELKAFPEESYHVVSNQPLGFVKAALKNSRLFIGGDSGPSHVAAAFGVPVVVLFGPTRPERSACRGPGPVIVLQDNPISDITIDMVEGAVLNFLRKSM